MAREVCVYITISGGNTVNFSTQNGSEMHGGDGGGVQNSE